LLNGDHGREAAAAVLNVRFWDRSMSGGAAELGPEAAIQSQLETSF
jgi:hypothetical protein